jgi:hypothetical protein
MKTVQTTVSTGDQVLYKGSEARIGLYKHGLISIHVSINRTSGYTEQFSTRKLNQLVKSGVITKTVNQ